MSLPDDILAERQRLDDEPEPVIPAPAPGPSRRKRVKSAAPVQTIKARFDQFHAAHPFVYTKLCQLARDAKAKGIKHYGMQTLMEVVRWHVDIGPYDSNSFKLNNDFCAHYARLIMAQEPDLARMFNLRVMKAA